MSDMYFKSLPDKSTPLIPSNLDKLNDIKVSPTEPTTNEKVWIQKGKNLYNPSTMPLKTGLWGNGTSKTIVTNSNGTFVVVPIRGGNTIAISKAKNTGIYCCTTSNYPSSGVSIIDNWTGTEPLDKLTINTSKDARYLFIGLYDINKLMVEYNSEATEYEAYVEKAIYVKNDNGMFEEFYKKEEYTISNTPSHIGGTNRYKLIKNGNVVVLNVDTLWVNSITKDTWIFLGNIPAEILLSLAIAGSGVLSRGDTGAVIGYGKVGITTDGILQVKVNVDYSNLCALGFNLTWIL